jgi:polyhydroxyalkanoate synthesis regulator phasin
MTEIDMKRVQEIFDELSKHGEMIREQSNGPEEFLDNIVKAGIELTLIKKKERYLRIFKLYKEKQNGN